MSHDSNESSTKDKQIKRSANDFVFGKVLGEGSFSTVYLAKDIHNNREYAIKVCEKKLILREKKVEQIKREKDVLLSLSRTKYFINLFCSFQDSSYLFFVLTYARNGELLDKINKLGKFDEVTVRFYSAEILLALEYLKLKRIVHRDLKPENIFLDAKMHILIGDFGSSKLLPDESVERTAATSSASSSRRSFVGTAQFVSPEILENKSVSCVSDLWSFGCLIFHMAVGKLAFNAASDYLIFRKILQLDYSFPEHFPDHNTVDIVTKLLVVDANKRAGSQDLDKSTYESLRNHDFFTSIDFCNLGESTILDKFAPIDSRVAFEDMNTGYDPLKLTKLEFNRFSSDF